MSSKPTKSNRIKLSEARKKFGATNWSYLIQKQGQDAAAGTERKTKRP